MSEIDHYEIDRPEEGAEPTARGRKVLSVAVIVLVSLGLAFSSIFGMVHGRVLPRVTSALDRPVEQADLPALYQQFRCPCCELDIGECTCGLAEARRSMIAERVSQGASRRDIYQLVYLQDGPGVFFDEEIASQTRNWLEASLPADRAELSVSPGEVELGAVSMADGPVSTRFAVKNAGRTDLTITGLATSCMCTSAALETAEGLGPSFGAHPDENPVGWSATLAPGEEAALVVTFDPNAHGPDAVGPFRRVITLSSDDPLQPAYEVQIAGEVVH